MTTYFSPTSRYVLTMYIIVQAAETANSYIDIYIYLYIYIYIYMPQDAGHAFCRCAMNDLCL